MAVLSFEGQLGVPLHKIIKTHLKYGRYFSLKEFVEKIF
jgi:hypothetical protein